VDETITLSRSRALDLSLHPAVCSPCHVKTA